MPDKTEPKKDEGKLMLQLIPPELTEGLGAVMTQAITSGKYKANSWREGVKYSKLVGAIKRHLLEIEKGEFIDPESEELHIWHIAANCAMLGGMMEQQQQNGLYKTFDDLPKQEE